MSVRVGASSTAGRTLAARAVGADTFHLHLQRAHLEPERVRYAQRIERGVVQVDHLAARDADEVVVRLAGTGSRQGSLVPAVLVQRVDVADGADLAQRLQ